VQKSNSLGNFGKNRFKSFFSMLNKFKGGEANLTNVDCLCDFLEPLGLKIEKRVQFEDFKVV
jgi:hypothetical protein